MQLRHDHSGWQRHAVRKGGDTHFSVIDKEGNAVSSTYTLNGNFGSGIVVDGAGFLLNNEMDNFNLQPGKTECERELSKARQMLSGGQTDAQRHVADLCPENGKLMLITGSPGSNRIIKPIFRLS